MVIQPHDLLELKEPLKQLITDASIPDWVHDTLEDAPFVVVRRAPIKNGKVPVGVRGYTRSERFAAFISIDSIARQITPEQLAREKRWLEIQRDIYLKAIDSLDLVEEVLHVCQLDWGPVGSVGFELASGRPTIHESSDLDIVIRGIEGLSLKTAQKIIEEFDIAPARIDPLVETPEGAFSLIEYSCEVPSMMLRTKEGPILVSSSSL
ncbi:phosphoribosyl-dephospho-CoA transferase [Thalassobacillus devorans]|uniref:Phosphoribosyl-dephospho-CoA transferase n=1 Tax=Thalassobacillus devorans TaxID=279813 RepID=A0ABQ1NRL0_9BACI|nr:malonate decarboxylase holo-ACP synthase [Thalassobacillus devorans]NIK28790.1 phosphoribosyl-dephospho-CoA transferase [Thalassobacillus devorans]GGC83516.1 phosphoribosyl-dephospho-CoA transferase [Thalassobacillus devorans]